MGSGSESDDVLLDREGVSLLWEINLFRDTKRRPRGSNGEQCLSPAVHILGSKMCAAKQRVLYSVLSRAADPKGTMSNRTEGENFHPSVGGQETFVRMFVRLDVWMDG